MSCKACEDFQESTYFRWKNANVEVRACPEHLKEVFDALQSQPDLLEACQLVLALFHLEDVSRGPDQRATIQLSVLESSRIFEAIQKAILKAEP